MPADRDSDARAEVERLTRALADVRAEADTLCTGWEIEREQHKRALARLCAADTQIRVALSDEMRGRIKAILHTPHGPQDPDDTAGPMLNAWGEEKAGREADAVMDLLRAIFLRERGTGESCAGGWS